LTFIRYNDSIKKIRYVYYELSWLENQRL